MIVDASALVAIAFDEPEAARLERIVLGSPARMAAPTMLEASMVIEGARDPTARRFFDSLVERLGIDVIPFTAHQAELARAAFRDFGRGSGHPARLNFGDCISYATAKDLRETLLFKGDDFIHTDIRSALTGE